MSNPESDNTPQLRVNFHGEDFSPYQQGKYSFLENSAYLLPETEFVTSVSELMKEFQFKMSFAENFPGQDSILLQSLEAGRLYCKELLRNHKQLELRWESACSHEVAHHFMNSKIEGLDKIDHWLRYPKEIPSERWNEINKKNILLRSLQELNSTLFELSLYKDLGAIFILMPNFYEDVFFDAFGSQDQVEYIQSICEAKPIAGEYNLACLSLFCKELIGISSELTPDQIYDKVRQEIHYFLEQPSAFVEDRIIWYEEINDALLNSANELVKEMTNESHS